MLSPQLLTKNRLKIKNSLPNASVAVIHSGYLKHKSADAFYDFLVNANFYYLTGINQDDVILVLVKNNEHFDEHLFIAPNDEVMAKWVGHKLTKEEVEKITNIESTNIHYLDEFDHFINQLLHVSRYSTNLIEHVYLDLEQNEIPQFSNFGLQYAKFIAEKYPAVTIKNVYPLIIEKRMVKEDEEIKLIKQSIETTKKAIYHVMQQHHEIDNEQKAAALYHYINYVDGKKSSFDSIVASGKNSTILHYINNDQAIEKGSLVLMDVGCFTNHYSSDISRTFPIDGKFTKRQKAIYEVVLECNKKCIAYAKEGMTWQQLNNYAKEILAKGCEKLGLITDESQLSQYYYHSIGHSLGLDVHDPCLRQMPLQKGMVITIEPGLYIEAENIGIRIEDNIVITEDKAINLSDSIVKEVADIEKLMS